MPDNSMDHAIHFELVNFRPPTGIPHGWDAQIIEMGVPRPFAFMYEVARSLTLVEGPQGEQLVCFGTTLDADRLCLDPQSGRVVFLAALPDSPLWLINSSLERFIKTVHYVMSRFPYYSRGSGLAQRDLVGKEIAARIEQLDPAALDDVDGYWHTFIDDLVIGDYATEDILS